MALQVEMTADNAKLLRGIAQLEKKVESLQGKLAKVGKAGRRSGEETAKAFKKADRAGKEAFNPKRLAVFAGGILGAGGVVAALGLVNRGYETSLKNLREISTEARKAGRDIVAFAALQEGGTKAQRVQQAAGLAAQFGVTDRGQAFDTVQALQSALGGDFKRGLAAARTVFAATQVGIPVELGRELEILGASQGQAPGVALRRAFAAGQASARDPAALARAAPALQFFKDKEFGFASAAVIAASIRPEQLETFTKAAGIGLSGVSTLAPTFERLGVAGASRRAKLEALSQAGLTTPEALKRAGLGEIRQQQAISTLVRNLPELDRIQAAIREKAVPGLFVRQRRDIEAEIPNLAIERRIDSLEVQFKNVTAFGPQSREALLTQFVQKQRGISFRAAGFEQTLAGFDFIDEEGRVSGVGHVRMMLDVALRELFSLGKSDAAERFGRQQKIFHSDEFRAEYFELLDSGVDGSARDRSLLNAAEKLENASGSLERATRSLEQAVGGGPALKRPEVDK